MINIKFVDIDGFKLGHAQDYEGGTGCSVILCEKGASAGVDVRGGAPGTRETDLLDPKEMVDKIHAVVLSGGSAFGLEAASGVMDYLENKQIGFDVGVTKVPIVCQAVLFDLPFGDYKCRPNKKMGFNACINSENYFDDLNGNIGAGTGATIGKIKEFNSAMKGGLGSFAIQVGDLQVGAIVAVNALGDIYDENGKLIAGALDKNTMTLMNTEETMLAEYNNQKNLFNGNTTIGAIITNATLTKAQANKVASMAHNGYGRAIRPVHTTADGDTIFAMASNKVIADPNVVGFLAAKVMEKAIIKGIKSAESSKGIISYKELYNIL